MAHCNEEDARQIPEGNEPMNSAARMIELYVTLVVKVLGLKLTSKASKGRNCRPIGS